MPKELTQAPKTPGKQKPSKCRRGDESNSFSCFYSSGCFPFLESERYKKNYRSWVLLSLALIISCLSSGVFYGWPTLRLRLLLEASKNAGSALKTTTPVFTEKELGLMYTLGSWSTQGGRFFMGLARDRFGTRIVACSSLVGVVAGMFGIGLVFGGETGDPSAVLLTASLVAIGLGSGSLLCVQPVACLFPNQIGVITSILQGTYQISGLVFLVLTARTETNLRVSFCAFGACILVLVVLSAILLPVGDSFLLPEEGFLDEEELPYIKDDEERGCCLENRHSPQQEHEEVHGNDSRVLKHRIIESNYTYDGATENDRGVEPAESDAGVEQESSSASKSESCSSGMEMTSAETENTRTISMLKRNSIDDPPPSAWQLIKNPEYVLLCTWFSIGHVPSIYYIGIIGYQLQELGDNAGFYSDLYLYCYAGTAITAPIAGYIADKYGLGVAQGLFTGLLALPFFLLALKDSFGIGIQVIGFVAFGIGVMGFYGLYFTNCGKRFEYSNYGTLSGFGLLVSALTGLLQFPLITWTINGHSALVNALMGFALVLQAPYFVWLHKREQSSSSALSL